MNQPMMSSGRSAAIKVLARTVNTAQPAATQAADCSCKTQAAPEFRHPYNRDQMWVDLYCGVKPCSECPRGDICEDYDGGITGMPETFNPGLYR